MFQQPGGGVRQQPSHDDYRANPFVHGQYGNNSFSPQRLGSKPMVSE
jgi:hypothetical protein